VGAGHRWWPALSTPTTPRRASLRGRSTPPVHLDSHAILLRDASNRPAPSGRSWQARLDAVIVPTVRPSFALAGIVERAAELGILLVVLCSGQVTVDQVTERIGRTPRARALVIRLNEHFDLPMSRFETSAAEFARASADRRSDLSRKRNLGLLLARAMGWRKILFVDDDITLKQTDLARIAGQLENYEIAAMTCPDYPDNSVYCHARRMAKLPQDVFVSGAVLGVNCSDLPLPFFPDIYNEDWFFFGEAAASHRLTKAGEAVQAEYNPFGHPDRAAFEEFGDLLAEGLYSLIQGLGPGHSLRQVSHRANAAYWTRFIEARNADLVDLQGRLEKFLVKESCGDRVKDAINSLTAARDQYCEDRITPGRCVDFLEAWRQDVATWSRTCSAVGNLGIAESAMDWLQPSEWDVVRSLQRR
jgi:hypothetical protein